MKFFFAFFLPLLLVCLAGNGLDHSTVQWKVGFSVLGLFPAYFLYQKYRSILLALSFYWAFFSANYLVNDYYNIYSQSSELVFNSFQATGAISICVLLLFAFFFIYIRKGQFPYLMHAFGALGLVNAAIVCVQGALYGKGMGVNGDVASGFFSYAGMNACFIACVYPLSDRFVERISYINSRGTLARYLLKLFPVALVISALIVSEATIPFGVFFVGFLGYELSSLRRETLYQVLAFFVVLSFSLVPAITTLPDFWGGSSRFSMYQDFMGWWEKQDRHWVGMGQGSFENLSLPIQKQLGKAEVKMKDEKKIGYVKYEFMHSDWTQLLFEQGQVGFALLFILVMQSLCIVWQRRAHALFGTLLAYSACAVLNYPLRICVFSFLGASLVGYALLLGARLRQAQIKALWRAGVDGSK